VCDVEFYGYLIFLVSARHRCACCCQYNVILCLMLCITCHQQSLFCCQNCEL